MYQKEHNSAAIVPPKEESISTKEVAQATIFCGTGGCTEACPADTNGDGIVSPADFNAWIQAFNTQSAACDQNGDGLCSPADFNAWIQNYNTGCP